MIRTIRLTGLAVAAVLGLSPGIAHADDSSAHPEGELHTAAHIQKGSLKDVSRQANNPLSTLWTLQNQFDIRTVSDIPLTGGGTANDKAQFAWGFQPVLPLHLTEEINLINRAVIPFLEVNPVPDNAGGVGSPAAFGDIVMANVVAPNKAKGFIFGLGPTWSFPTASSSAAGSGKWEVGPAAAAFYVGSEWIFGVFPQQWFSIAGDSKRSSTSRLDANYFIWRLLPNGWQIGFSQDLLVDWKARSGNKVTLPVGIGFGKTGKIGGRLMKVTFQTAYAVVTPDDVGQRVDFKIQITPIVGALCCSGTLF